MPKKQSKNIELSQKIIDALKDIQPEEWHKVWSDVASGIARNAKTDKPYRKLNLWLLMLAKTKKKYKDNRWLTFNQAKELGGSVKANQKATELVYYSEYDKLKKKPFDLEELKAQDMTNAEINEYKEKNVYTSVNHFYVFNVEQCENLKGLSPIKELSDEEIILKTNKTMDEIIKNWPVSVVYDAKDMPFYDYENDVIHCIPIKNFKSVNSYYATMCHLIAKSTASKTRLNRNIKQKPSPIEQAREEMLAEITSLMLQSQCGINIMPDDFKNQTNYIANWLQLTKPAERPYELVSLISQADKICSYILDKTLSKEFVEQLEKELANNQIKQ